VTSCPQRTVRCTTYQAFESTILASIRCHFHVVEKLAMMIH